MHNTLTIDILMIVYNRSAYTNLSLRNLLDTCDESMRVWIWQNGQDQSVTEVLNRYKNHPNVYKIVASPENKKLREPTNWFWKNSTAPYLAKVDDDCLVPKNWAQNLRESHELNNDLGAIGCWIYYDEDYKDEIARQKIRKIAGTHNLLSNCWVGGSGYLMKRRMLDDLGPLKPSESFTSYCLRGALKGWSHGWLHPLMHQEHMDDPRSKYCTLKTEEDFQNNTPLTATNFNVTTLEGWKRHVADSALTLQKASPNPKHHMGWRKSIKRAKKQLKKLIGI